MRQRPYQKAAPKFAFWTRCEIVRLGVMAIACAIPLMMPEAHSGQRSHRARPAADLPNSSGQVRAIRVTKLDLSPAGFAALGDTGGGD